MSLIFEKLIKNRIIPTLKKQMTSFQTGGVKSKRVTDNLFLLRSAIDHCRYLGEELWLTFYDIEKCVDSPWLEDSINSLYENWVNDDILDLIYGLNPRYSPWSYINNCSLDQICKEGKSYQNGNIQLKLPEFVDDTVDPNDGYCQAQ